MKVVNGFQTYPVKNTITAVDPETGQYGTFYTESLKGRQVMDMTRDRGVSALKKSNGAQLCAAASCCVFLLAIGSLITCISGGCLGSQDSDVTREVCAQQCSGFQQLVTFVALIGCGISGCVSTCVACGQS